MMRRSAILMLATSMLAFGCSDDTVNIDDAGMDAGGDAMAPDTGTGETGPGEAGPDDAGMDAGMDAGGPRECEDTGEDAVFVVSTLGAPIDKAQNVAAGLNLDGNQDAVCGVADWQGPSGSGSADGGLSDPSLALIEGQSGIDNGLFSSPLGDIIPGLIESELPPSILSGEILILSKLEHVDDFENDDCVDVSLLFGLIPEGVTDPMSYIDSDGDGEIDSDLTIDVDGESFNMMGEPLVRSEGVRIQDGVLTAGLDGLELSLGDLVLTLDTGRVRLDVSDGPDGSIRGILAGAAGTATLAEAIGSLLGQDPGPIEGQLRTVADFNPEMPNVQTDAGVGTGCDALSVGFTFQAKPAMEGVTRTTGGMDGGMPEAGMEAGTMDADTMDAATEAGTMDADTTEAGASDAAPDGS